MLLATTIRKKGYSPGSLQLFGRGLAVVGQVVLSSRPLKEGESLPRRRRLMNKFVAFVRECAKSSTEKKAQEGQGFNIAEEEAKGAPHTLGEMLEFRSSYESRISILEKKIKAPSWGCVSGER